MTEEKILDVSHCHALAILAIEGMRHFTSTELLALETRLTRLKKEMDEREGPPSADQVFGLCTMAGFMYMIALKEASDAHG